MTAPITRVDAPLAVRRDAQGGIWRLMIADRGTYWHAWIELVDPHEGHQRVMADAWAGTHDAVLAEATALLADPNIIPPGATAWDERRLPPPIRDIGEALFT